jgi:hypothetical protein
MLRGFLVPALLALLTLAVPFGQAHHEPAEVRYLLPGYWGNSVVGYYSMVCIDLSDGAEERVSREVGCVLSAPDADVVRIKVTQDPGLRASFEYRGLTDEGADCGQRDMGFDVAEIERAPGCTHYAVVVFNNGYSGTIAIW